MSTKISRLILKQLKTSSALILSLIILFSSCQKARALGEQRVFIESFSMPDGNSRSGYDYLISRGWSLDSGARNEVYLETSKPYYIGKSNTQPNRSLKISSLDKFNLVKDASKFQDYSSQDYLHLRIWFYDLLDKTAGKSLYLGLRNKEGKQLLVGFDNDSSPSDYIIKINNLDSNEGRFRTHISRKKGWRLIEFVIVPQGRKGEGAYALIDGEMIAIPRMAAASQNRGRRQRIVSNPNITSYDKFVVTAKGKVTSYIDQFFIDKPPTDNSLLIENVVATFVNKYRNTIFGPGLTDYFEPLPPNSPTNAHGFEPTTYMRTATVFAIYGKMTADESLLDKAADMFEIVITKVPWESENLDKWRILPTMGENMLYALPILWDRLDTNTRNQAIDIITQAADYYLDKRPGGLQNGETTNVPAPYTENFPYFIDTDAESNAWIARFLAQASYILSSSPHSDYWLQQSRCFAYHALTTKENEKNDPNAPTCLYLDRAGNKKYYKYNTRTLFEDFSLANHNIVPNPLYQISTIYSLGVGTINNPNTERASEFTHNVDRAFKRYLGLDGSPSLINHDNQQVTLNYERAQGGFHIIAPAIYGFFNKHSNLKNLLSSLPQDQVLTNNYLFWYGQYGWYEPDWRWQYKQGRWTQIKEVDRIDYDQTQPPSTYQNSLAIQQYRVLWWKVTIALNYLHGYRSLYPEKDPVHPINSTVARQSDSFCSYCSSGIPSKSQGNANCDQVIDLVDFNLWLSVYQRELNNQFVSEEEKSAVDFNCQEGNVLRRIDLNDFAIWQKNYLVTP